MSVPDGPGSGTLRPRLTAEPGGRATEGESYPMTVLMTANQSHPLGGNQCRVEWQGIAADDVVTAHLQTGQGTTVVFPEATVTGIRQQPFVPNAWLLDLAVLPSGWQKLDLVVSTPTARNVSLAVEIRPTAGGALQSLQHSGLTTVPQ